MVTSRRLKPNPGAQAVNTSEREFQCTLHNARRSEDGRDRTLDATGVTSIWPNLVRGIRSRKVRMIEGVEHLPAKLQRVLLEDQPILREPRVRVVIRRPSHDVLAGIPERSGRVFCEGIDVEVLIEPLGPAAVTHVQRLTWNQVSMVFVSKRFGVVISESAVHGEGLSGLRSDDGAH